MRVMAAVLLIAATLAGCGTRERAAPVVATPAPVRAAYTAEDLADVVEITDVALSPLGDELAWVSDASGSLELWTAPIAGGKAGTPVQRTFAKETVGELAYSKNGDLVFQMDHGGDERYDLWILRRAAAKPEILAGTDLAEQSAFFSPDGARIAYEADTERPFRFDLVVRDLATGRVTPMTHEPVNVWGGAWSRDGKLLAGVVTPDDQRGELIVVDVATRKSTRVKPPRPDGILSPIEFLPDGTLLATTVNDLGFTQLALVDVKEGSVDLAGTRDWDIENVAVADDGTVLYTRNVAGESELVLARGFGGRRPALDTLHREGVVSAVDLSPDGKLAAVVRQGSNRPAEIALVDLTKVGPSLGRLDTAVTEAVAAKSGRVDFTRLALARSQTFESVGKLPVQAWIYKPPVARLGGTAPPLVVRVHGGPNAQARPVFDPDIQVLVEAGFVVAAPNYRGSTGFGRAFEDANNMDWGGGDLKDLLAVVDGLALEGTIDRNRVGITGGSYGGYMTLRALTATPDDWGAGVARYGMPDLVKDYEMTVDRFGTWYETEMGTPQTHPELFRDRSPIHTLHRVRAPLLVLQGANDTNVPKWESDLVVDALRARGAVVDYVVYANEGHGFTHRENRLDAMKRTTDWFVTHLGGRADAGTAK